MLIGLNTSSIAGKDMLEQIEWISSNGFDTVEIECCPSPSYANGVWARKISKKSLGKLKKATGGFRKVSFHAPYHFFDVNLISPNPLIRKISVEEIVCVMDLANELSGGIITVHSGLRNFGITDAEVDKYLEESLSVINSEARKRKIDIGVEVADYFLCPKRFEVIENLKLTNVGITLDIGHLCFPQKELSSQPGFTQYGSIENVIKRYASKIVHVHLHDFDFSRNKDHLPLGAGNLNIKSIIAALQDINYTAAVLMEFSIEVPLAGIIAGRKYLAAL
ncbi:MAG: sugar phosphate isomerase/epimerase [Victivallaceae bacterium]|nr:sugar phosphate isomerase/epimerase [Victivallaceae bacterium]